MRSDPTHAEVVDTAPDNALETDLWMVRYQGEQYWVEGERQGEVLTAVAEEADADLSHVNLNASVTEPVVF